VGTIRDWYLNAEGGGVDPSGHDWKNDDHPDRNPDSWLDRLMPSAASAGHDAERASSTTPAKSRQSKPTKSQQPSTSRKQSGRTSKKAGAKARAVTVQEVLARQRQAPAQAKTFEQFAEAVRKLHAEKPELGAKRLASELRKRGWLNFRRSHVVLALAGNRPIVPEPREQTPRPAVVRPTQPAGRSHSNTGRKQPGADQERSSTSSAQLLPIPIDLIPDYYRGSTLPSARETPPGFCPACGVRVTPLGSCRCS
jgi:hypothetical protein